MQKIAVIAGDGIGKEVVPQGIRVLETAAKAYGFELEWAHFDWSCDYFRKNGRMMPTDGLDQLREHEAVYLGAVGHPEVPDHISLWGLLMPIRRGFDQYVNMRPVRLSVTESSRSSLFFRCSFLLMAASSSRPWRNRATISLNTSVR